ncbi:MAG TPA: hypothetical protein VIG99_23620 [Myxococcaceae bacterium]
MLPALVAALALSGAGEGGGSTPGARVRHEVLLTSPEAAAAGGLMASGTVTGADGGVRLEGPAALALDPARWFPAAGNPEGWAVELRLRPLPEQGPCAKRPVSVLLSDGRVQVTAFVGPEEVALSGSGAPGMVKAIASSASARTWRLELQGKQVVLRMDGQEVLRRDVAADRAAQPPGVTFSGPACSSAPSEWEMIAWETRPRPVPPGLDPRRIHPAVEVSSALEALSAGLQEKHAAAVQALKLDPPALACAARIAVDDAIRLGARRAFEAQAHPPRTLEPPAAPKPPTPWNAGGCPEPDMPAAEVAERARFAARTLSKLASTLDRAGLEKAREALTAPSPRAPPKPPPEEPLDLLGGRERQGPICDPAGPCDCRPRPPARFPFPAEVADAARAAELVELWPDHPQHVYDALVSASAALTAPEDQAQLAAHLKAVAAGKRTCVTRP